MQPLTFNNKSCVSSAAGSAVEGDAPTYTSPGISVSGGASLKGIGYDRPDRSPQRVEKAQRFFQKRMEDRKNPACCPRCGGPRGAKFKTCDKCRDAIKKAKLRARGYAVTPAPISPEALAAMVFRMRREMDKMQVRFRLWQRAAEYRRNLKYRTNKLRKKYLPKTMSLQELATINHAYDHES